MKHLNKRLPIVVLQVIKKSIDNNSNLYKATSPGELILKLIDRETQSGFFFNIEKFDAKDGLLINFKPMGQESTESLRAWITIKSLDQFLKTWVDCLNAYSEVGDLYEDQFLNEFEAEYLGNFQAFEDEIKNKPLTPNQMLVLDGYLEVITVEINNYLTDENSENIEEIIEESTYLRTQLGKQTREWIAKKFCSILAKITKEGPKVLKNIFKEAGKQIMEKGITYLFEHIDKII
jgi:hypothetical protein